MFERREFVDLPPEIVQQGKPKADLSRMRGVVGAFLFIVSFYGELHLEISMKQSMSHSRLTAILIHTYQHLQISTVSCVR